MTSNSSVSAAASFKKKDGVIVLKEHTVEWTAKGSTCPSTAVDLSTIKNLQSTPASSSKTMIKIFATESASTEPTAHIFNFTAPSKARAELEAFVSALQQTIATKKAQVIARPRQTISDILANQDILNDSDLQESLLKSNIDLSTTFREAVINGSLSPAQFWSNRGPLLRAHAVEKGQQKGPYNVLATIKPKTVDNQLRVNMTREKIHDVFNQHPVLQEVYNENVPPLTEDQFWGRFFVSRLCKKLRGERILPASASSFGIAWFLSGMSASF